MINIILTDIIPIFIIMILGFIAGKRSVFSPENARIFNKLVLTYALPAALFVSIVRADREMLFSDLKLTIVSLVFIIALFLWAYFSCYKFFKHTQSEAAVCALIAGSPTIGFLGFAVLDPIFGDTANTGLVVAIVSIVVNAITIPIGLSLLAAGKKKEKMNTGAAAQPSTNATQTAQEPKEKGLMATIHKNAVLSALSQPVSWAPILAVLLVLFGVRFPKILDPNFELIANANAGVAVFAAGLTLSGLKFQMDWEIVYNTIVKLILMPGILLLVGWLIHMDAEKLQMLVLAGALPPAFSGIIIGSHFQTYVRAGTSSLAFSVLLFVITAPFWIWFTRMIAS
ncbi:MAG: transporter YfdV [Paludibacteraceae bacterium]